MFIARVVCGVTHVAVAVLFCSSSLLCISNSDWTTENEAGRSVSVNRNEEPRWRDLSPIQFSSNCNYSVITHNKTPVHSTWGLLRVYAACPTPRLNLSSELRPSWEQHPRYVSRRVHAGYNSTNTMYPRQLKYLDAVLTFISESCYPIRCQFRFIQRHNMKRLRLHNILQILINPHWNNLCIVNTFDSSIVEQTRKCSS